MAPTSLTHVGRLGQSDQPESENLDRPETREEFFETQVIRIRDELLSYEESYILSYLLTLDWDGLISSLAFFLTSVPSVESPPPHPTVTSKKMIRMRFITSFFLPS